MTERPCKACKCFEVDSWADLKGLPARIDRQAGMINRFGHYLKDKWVDPRALAAEVSG